MKNVILGLIAISSFSVSAAQSINCRQINKSGSITKNGIELTLKLTSKKTGSASVKGLTKNPSDSINQLVVRGVNQGTAGDGSNYTTLFLRPKNDDGSLDIQLQFSAAVLGKVFANNKASFVVASDSANSEYGFAYGYDVVCSSL